MPSHSGFRRTPRSWLPFFSLTRFSGQTWSVWTYPDHTKMVGVGRMAEGRKDALRVGGEGASLVHGHIAPRGKDKQEGGVGLTLELTGLEPGHAYNIAFFGLGLSVDRDIQGKEKHQMDVSSSDAPDQPQMLDWDNGPLRNQPRFVVYEYTAPENGQISFTFKSPEGPEHPARLLYKFPCRLVSLQCGFCGCDFYEANSIFLLSLPLRSVCLAACTRPARDLHAALGCERRLEFCRRPSLPNVLLIGDSISIGYTRIVREKLQGKANVYRPTRGRGAGKLR